MLTAIQGEINSNKIIVEHFNTPLTPMDKSPKQNLNKKIQALNDTLDHTDLTDMFRTFHMKEAEYILSSRAHETFSRIDDMLGHK